MTTPVTILIDTQTVFDIGALSVVVSIIACLAVLVSQTVDPTQAKLNKIQGSLDQIQGSNQEIINLIKSHL